MQAAWHTRPEGHFKVWATFIVPRGRCHLLLGLKQCYPFHSPYGCRRGYHQFEARPVEQKALTPQFYVASVMTGIQTHTLLIKHQCLNPVLLTARPWHCHIHFSSYFLPYRCFPLLLMTRAQCHRKKILLNNCLLSRLLTSFTSAAPSLWNNLSLNIRQANLYWLSQISFKDSSLCGLSFTALTNARVKHFINVIICNIIVYIGKQIFNNSSFSWLQFHT